MNKQVDIITDLLIDFDEMGFCPTTSCPDPDAYAIEWRNKMTKAIKCYRTDVAREIFEDICENYADFLFDGHRNIVMLTEKDFEELRKKYESEGAE